jgi:hypothetical protein
MAKKKTFTVTWDSERVEKILEDHALGADGAHPPWNDTRDALILLIAGVRAEAIGWCWTEACSHYDRGNDPRNILVPDILERAILDLNPERGR